MTPYTYTTTHSISVEDTYDIACMDIPTGYEVIAFRPPCLGELFIPCFGGMRTAVEHFTHSNPRLILRAKPKPEVLPENYSVMVSVKDIYGGPVTIPEGWRFVRFARVIDKEYFIPDYHGEPSQHKAGHGDKVRIIVERVK